MDRRFDRIVAALIAVGIWAAALTLGMGHASAAPLAVLTFKEEATVDGHDIVLGDVADIDSDDARLSAQLRTLVVGRAPLPGDTRQLSAGSVLVRMRQAKLPVADIVVHAEHSVSAVTRSFQVISGERLAEAVVQALQQAAVVPDGASLHVSVQGMDEVVPDGPVVLQAVVDEFRWGRVSVPVQIVVDGHPYKRIMVRADIQIEQDIWVTARTWSRGDELAADSIERARRVLPAPVHGPATVDAPLRATRYIRGGSILTWDVVEPSPQVFKGESVLAVVEMDGISLSVSAEALADGWTGQVVPVRNVESGNTFAGRLNGDGLIIVEIP